MALFQVKQIRPETLQVGCEVLFRADVKWFNKWRGEVDSSAYNTLIEMAMCNAMNYAYLYMSTRIPKEIAKVYDITVDSLLDHSHKATFTMHIKQATNKADQGGIKIMGNRLPVMRFNVIPNRPPRMAGIPISSRQLTSVSTVREGVTETGEAFGGGRVGRGRFVQKMTNSSHVGVFFNKIPSYRAKTGNYAIDEEYMISGAEMVRGFRLREKLQSMMNRSFLKTFNAEMEYTSKVMKGKA